MLPIEASTQVLLNGLGMLMLKNSLRLPTRPNWVPYMKPHMRVATTAGTAYGRKIAMRKKLERCSRALSMARAAKSAMPSMIGTWITKNRVTRPIDSQNLVSVRAWA